MLIFQGFSTQEETNYPFIYCFAQDDEARECFEWKVWMCYFQKTFHMFPKDPDLSFSEGIIPKIPILFGWDWNPKHPILGRGLDS